MDLSQLGALLSGGGVLAFAAMVYFMTRDRLDKLDKAIGKSLDILRAIEERTSAPDPGLMAPEHIRRVRLRTSPEGVRARTRPGAPTDKEE